MPIPQDLAHLSTEELIAEVERRAYDRGRRDGYAEGYNTKRTEEYTRGFDEGHKVGHRQGFDAGRQQSHRQRKNDAVRNFGIHQVHEELRTAKRDIGDLLTAIQSNIDQMLTTSGMGPYTPSGRYKQ